MKALIIGATGATGKDLVDQLCLDSDYEQIDIFVRRRSDFHHEKVKAHLVDFDQPEEWKHLVKGDVAFACLGTTLKTAGSKDNQWKIDYDYQYNFAIAAKENQVEDFVLVSSYGANPNSKIFYSRMKGELEEAIKNLKFEKTTFFKPGMLERKNTDRNGEVFGLKALKFINKLGLFKSQQPLPTSVLAKAMINASKIKSKSFSEISLHNIFSFAEKKN
ncbi:NAD(P)H-binding protein [Epilithonimonas xixisoli]|uniref:Putative NAD(P)-binding protein n=1 Tax=Epilithonimonas xixisoli TaxID=1476462 RepID=A0A4R8IK18_9FLAO|nr:NAD(P)H-binding protein [Epilithonimonas xixisoli]TDX87265.1 putative NAD(P)-binding protein [Epilithonimonas xixisoli]